MLCSLSTKNQPGAAAHNPIVGIAVLEVAHTKGNWVIDTIFSEFNSLSWAVDMGIVQAGSPAPPPS
jgi:hypothetical protein